jgi:uncharacterized protein YneF (UPF0154 family)
MQRERCSSWVGLLVAVTFAAAGVLVGGWIHRRFCVTVSQPRR